MKTINALKYIIVSYIMYNLCFSVCGDTYLKELNEGAARNERLSRYINRFNRSGAQVLQQVRISFLASTDLELKYYNRFVSLSPLQQIWSSSITTGSYLFPRFNRSGAQVLQQVRISFPASIDLELKYYNRFVYLSPLQ